MTEWPKIQVVVSFILCRLDIVKPKQSENPKPVSVSGQTL